jgi:hypothetical protein
MIVRTTAKELNIRSLPIVRPDTLTGARLVRGQTAMSHGVSHDGGWQYIEAPAQAGWASSRFLELAPADAPRLTPPNGYDELIQTFGNIRKYIRADGTLQPEWVRNYITGRIVLPAPLPLSWSSGTVNSFACHRAMQDILQAVYNETYAKGLWDLLVNYGGCYNFRPTRGSTAKLSTHCWGIAVDHDAEHSRNGLGVEPKIDMRIVEIFEAHGFLWGGRWRRKDGMHFQFVTGF